MARATIVIKLGIRNSNAVQKHVIIAAIVQLMITTEISTTTTTTATIEHQTTEQVMPIEHITATIIAAIIEQTTLTLLAVMA